MKGGIFLIKDDKKLVEMTEQKYESEDLLQELLADYPNLLAGDQMNSDTPRRWLLITREAGVPDEEGGAGRWSLDHLFLDQDAIPTLVEVKRSSDTRIRREVVGQMLDYAANAVVHWPVESIMAKFENNYEDSEATLAEFIGQDISSDEFWKKVKTNLQAGKVRLVFVADEIPSELRRVVEFLNVQMDPAEVLAVEISQFVGEGLKTLVPRVIGQTEEAKTRKSGGGRASREWDETSFFQEMESISGREGRAVAQKLYDWGESNNLHVKWGRGNISGSYVMALRIEGKDYSIFSVSTESNGKIYFQFGRYPNLEPFDSLEKRKELLERLNSIENVSIPDEVLTTDKYPSVPILTFKNESILNHLIGVFEWFIKEVKSS